VTEGKREKTRESKCVREKDKEREKEKEKTRE